MRKTEELTKDHMAARLNVCLCYSSKDEILSAVERTVDLATQGKLPSQLATEESKRLSENTTAIKITQSDFESQLYGGFNCKPDILIRTSNEIRLSNFLLYQTDET
jgi:undecaprenyl diphosphate synthase